MDSQTLETTTKSNSKWENFCKYILLDRRTFVRYDSASNIEDIAKLLEFEIDLMGSIDKNAIQDYKMPGEKLFKISISIEEVH